MGEGKRSKNRAAFERADVADAKRGHPDFDLRGYAAERGLGFYDQVTMAGYRAAMPADAEYQANLMLGTLPGGEHGMMVHEAFALPVFNGKLAWDGAFHSVRLSNIGSAKDVLLGSIPVVGDLMGGPGDFPDACAPCTVAAVRMPETVGVQPRLRIDQRGKAPPFDFGNKTSLGELGVPGWSVQSEPAADPAFLAELLADPVAGVLRSRSGDGLFQVLAWWGTLVVRRNGYLEDPRDLDALGQAASLIADRLRQVCLARHQPQPFDQPLPAPAPAEPHQGLPAGYDGEPIWPMWGMQLESQHGLTAEDTTAYHRAFPSSAVPGVARLVFRGTLPQLGREGRLVFHEEPHGARAAVLFSAPPGAEPTPQGGIPLSDRRVYWDVRDGIACVWCLPSYWGGDALLNDLDSFLATAAGVARERLPAA